MHRDGRSVYTNSPNDTDLRNTGIQCTGVRSIYKAQWFQPTCLITHTSFVEWNLDVFSQHRIEMPNFFIHSSNGNLTSVCSIALAVFHAVRPVANLHTRQDQRISVIPPFIRSWMKNSYMNAKLRTITYTAKKRSATHLATAAKLFT